MERKHILVGLFIVTCITCGIFMRMASCNQEQLVIAQLRAHRYQEARQMVREQPQCDGCQVEFQAQIDLALERHDLRTYVEDHVHCVKMKSVSIDGLISKLEVTAIDNGSIDPGCSEIDLKKLRKALVELKVFEK